MKQTDYVGGCWRRCCHSDPTTAQRGPHPLTHPKKTISIIIKNKVSKETRRRKRRFSIALGVSSLVSVSVVHTQAAVCMASGSNEGCAAADTADTAAVVAGAMYKTLLHRMRTSPSCPAHCP